MTGFKPRYGHGQVLRLETTFRCPQAICDVSSRFVSKNPAQFKKNVNSVTAPIGRAFQAIQVEHRNKVAQAVDKYVERIYQQICEGSVPLGRGGKVNVFVLGRYKLDAKFLAADWQQRFGDRMAFRFKTVHTSKGDEADYVILPGMVMRGFPNVKVDDPLFSLVMPQGDTFPSSEERRLFYVALTRARRSVAMFTVAGRRSSFLQELIDEGVVAPTDDNGQAIKAERKPDKTVPGSAPAQAPAKAKGPACPGCKVGELIWRPGPYGKFLSCSTFPKCKYKPPKKTPLKAPVSGNGRKPVR
ncbi:superfamily I DNA or RNA helicase [Enterocytozoon bieneusi H348]|nr:superfamily I DNA or RNA helicase [Enterocytozoon bieneusi H348]|eukprot:XP_002650662.1 superfamily I DNA or RNA helicase [Enterocytozoon bieneusi H348]